MCGPVMSMSCHAARADVDSQASKHVKLKDSCHKDTSNQVAKKKRRRRKKKKKKAPVSETECSSSSSSSSSSGSSASGEHVYLDRSLASYI
jgi:hypothetical protein